ncbi:divalent-cation tolerance protein CutA [Oxalobacter sp. OttesenSCG-928-P03]|nr:divalent-cation tolerance protein CutA [Oxalobacter sp. OttesenSCG-928-P03]
MEKVLLVYSTAPDQETAKRIARELVEGKLAACVSMVPAIHSVYRWQGKVEEATEVCLMIKTTLNRLSELSGRLVALHPYDVPELIAVPVSDGLHSYMQWVREETA